jgi:DNA-binding CsgD family transcriptional regulator
MQASELGMPMMPPSHHLRDLNISSGEKRINVELEQELAVLSEWGQVQKSLLNAVLAPAISTHSWRKKIEDGIYQCTRGQAQIIWEPLSPESVRRNGHLTRICYQHLYYGMLRLESGYLVSHLAPDIHLAFAHLCALMIRLAEHQTLVELLVHQMPYLYGYESITPRERDVLEGMALGENEDMIGERLGIALTTVRTHRHSLYRRLETRSPQETVLRSFTLRILNWLDFSCSASSSAPGPAHPRPSAR